MISLSLIFVNTCQHYLILDNKEHIAQDLIGRDKALFCLDHPLMPHGYRAFRTNEKRPWAKLPKGTTILTSDAPGSAPQINAGDYRLKVRPDIGLRFILALAFTRGNGTLEPIQ
jgi:hypothetical protein